MSLNLLVSSLYQVTHFWIARVVSQWPADKYLCGQASLIADPSGASAMTNERLLLNKQQFSPKRYHSKRGLCKACVVRSSGVRYALTLRHPLA